MKLLTGVHMSIVGGDARQLEIIHSCVQMDANVSLIGYENLQSEISGASKRAFHPDSFRDVDVLVLPIVGSNEHGQVESFFSHESLRLTQEHVMALPKSAVVYTGMAKPILRELFETVGIPLVELLQRDDVAIYNSIPTVEGALMMAIQNTDFTIHDSHCIVLGFGRTGVTLARVLQALGAHVKVGVHRGAHAARVFEMGLQSFYTSDLEKNVAGVDILFNTVPKPIVTASVIANMPNHTFILDLASSPGGTDFRFADKRGIRAILAPSLPGIVAPKTAGRIFATTLFQLVREQLGIQEA